MESKKYIVFLDLDGTITSMNSGYALVRAARSKKLIGPGDIANALLCSFFYKLGIVHADRIINIMGRWLIGIKPETLTSVASEAAEKYLLHSIYPEIYDEIRLHRSRNAELAILSSAIEDICRPLARHLKIDHIICTGMEIRNGELTGAPSGNYCYGEEKKRRIILFCEEKGFDRKTAYYYADSFSDLEALESIGNPVCINPDMRLRKKARGENWQIRKWKKKSIKNKH
ncbi:MAG: HAD-IB family hydrolase [Bacteroidales bacterium]|jgi:HAD superfamily hydrolase (TIGR01490 family)